jgi:tRNA pseudouridine32 synthase/23S rRNA pseudouridine746 synthase
VRWRPGEAGAHAWYAAVVTASRVHLPDGPWTTVLEALCARFPRVDRAAWVSRLARGLVVDARGEPLALDAPFRGAMTVGYQREVVAEAPLPLAEEILHADEHLVVVDKPPFLPVMPGGGAVAETLIARLVRRLGNRDLVALHRLDRATAGLVLLSATPATRAAYHALFAERRIAKRYACRAPALPALAFPLVRATRLVPGEPFFRMCEAPGAPNSETCIEVTDASGPRWRYALHPVTGRKHQLRVHMAALGAPIENDPYYPELRAAGPDDLERPLALLADRVAFIDPISGAERVFESRRTL